ncbi:MULTISPECIES: hypothetical protein [Acinetobacter]|uniref:Uncharacterized protein n=1 Tax=Acinetobacter indicus TaxID=756892 RepID=A0A6C0Y7L4_9GAMM|nr:MULTISPECIES: hypothetical protein [Acinetobacter]QIC72099.1 hypothetical protein FSC09_17220 [Acinetobacter indicus]QKQ71500.1 hypothetical protein E5Y90_14810 [Acinetobacter sp. 10FS3-1]
MGLSEEEVKEGRYYISKQFSEEYYDHKYSSMQRAVTPPGNVPDDKLMIEPVRFDMKKHIRSKCEEKVVVTKHDLEKVKFGLRGITYMLTEEANVDRTPFYQCIENQLKTIDLDNENLQNLVQSSDYQDMKKQPEFEKEIQEIKKDGRVTLYEALAILSSMHKYSSAVDKAQYQTTINNL